MNSGLRFVCTDMTSPFEEYPTPATADRAYDPGVAAFDAPAGIDPTAGYRISDRDGLDGPGVKILVGTRKGLFIVAGAEDRSAWTLHGPGFLGHIIQHAMVDPRDGETLLVAAKTGHLGPTVFRSRDLGRTWAESSRPPAFRSGDAHGRAVRSVFWLTPGPADEPGSWYAGASPQGLFRSDDDGDTWEPVDGWNDHPQWGDWAEWPDVEGTPDGSMLHSVNVDPRDRDHLYIGLSGGGVFESTDGGKGWAPLNGGCAADFLPDPTVPYGHDPTASGSTPRCPTGCSCRTTAASTASTGRPRRGSASATTCPATSATSASRSSSTPARTPRGCSRWTAPTCGRALRPTAGRPCSAPPMPVRPGNA